MKQISHCLFKSIGKILSNSSLKLVRLGADFVLPLSQQEQEQVGPTPESNSNFKCILGPKRLWVKKKCWVQNILVPKKDLGPKKVFIIQK